LILAWFVAMEVIAPMLVSMKLKNSLNVS
jgi:hypothetical protein